MSSMKGPAPSAPSSMRRRRRSHSPVSFGWASSAMPMPRRISISEKALRVGTSSLPLRTT